MPVCPSGGLPGAFVVLNTLSVLTVPSAACMSSGATPPTPQVGCCFYRGMADIGRRHDVMPHRKWAQEFDLSEFPGFAEHLKTASVPIERDCRTTSPLTLLDTPERAILLDSSRMLGGDGTVYGLWFAVNQTYFPPTMFSLASTAWPVSCRIPAEGWMFRNGF